MKVTGYLRGKPLSVNSLVHIPGWGDFQMNQIDAPPDLNNCFTSKGKDADMTDTEIQVLEVADPAKQVNYLKGFNYNLGWTNTFLCCLKGLVIDLLTYYR